MFKKFLSAILSAVTAVSLIPHTPVNAEETVPYPYTLFAGSDEEGAITINSNNICINGSLATNGTINASAQNFNLNGTRKENAQEEMKLFFSKIDSRYFTSHVDTYFEDYFLEDTNININMPIEAEGDIGLTGNINITSGIKALNDVILSGNVENSQDSVICAETGDITINTDNVNLNGLVYAPYGCVNITAQNLNINSVIIIADTINITCPNLNANYNSQMAEFLGNESEPINTDDIEIVAYGEYDEETDVFSVYWNTTVSDGSFDIQVSDDGDNYISIGSVTNADSFEYSFTEPFEKEYIKVIETTNNGTVCESVPFIAISTENGYDTKVLDSDEDGLPDIYELKIGTDPYDTDTDDDGLTDYQEYVFTQTDPLVYDSVTEGISDSDADTDEDGLSNIDEFTRGTYPWTPDTDLDGLSDYDEIYVYGTDPLVADSDEDGIDDGSEIKLGLDPNDPATNGVPDGEYAVQQTISADNSILASINTAESPYVLSIDIKTNGDAEEELTVDESSYSAAIENDAMIGASVNIDITDTCNPEEIVLKYDIKEAYTDNTLDKFSSLGEFQGIKRLNVFRFDEEEGMLLPVETEFDVENNRLYAAVNETGTYCLMDMEIWLDNLDVEMPAANNVPAPKPAPNSLNKQINLVFMLQANYNQFSNETEEEYSQRFEFQKNIIRKMSRVVFSKLKGVDVKIYIIAYDNLERDCCITAPNDNKYFTDYKSISDALDEVNYKKTTSPANREIAFMCAEENTPVNTNSNTFVYNLINGESEYNTIHDIPSNTYINGYYIPAGSYADGYYLERITAYGNIYSQVYYDLNDFPESVLSAAIIHPSRGGLSIPFDMTSDSNFGNIKNHFFTNAQQRLGMVISDKFDIIVPTKWKKITLISDLTPNGATKSDKDPLTDWEEVDTSKITINSYGMVELPVFRLADIIGHLTRFNTNGEYNFLLNDPTPRYYLPIHSDPTDDDTDDDGLNDYDDPEPLKKAYIKPFGTDEYKAEVIQKAELKYQGSYNHTWYNILDGVLPYYLNIKKENDYIAKAELDIMMRDVNNYELYLKSVSDENWLRFCEFFNECVLEYGTVDEELHYFRLKLNRTPSSFAELVANKDNWYLYDKSHTAYHMNNNDDNTVFESSNPDYPSYSTYGNEYNMKFVDKYGMNEVVVTPKDITADLTKSDNWFILTDDYEKAQNDPNFKYDPVNVGTYNYSAYDFDYVNLDGSKKKTSSLNHNRYDVYPYLGGKSKYKNWGNVPGMIFRNTKIDRNSNLTKYNNSAAVSVYEEWREKF